MDVAIDRDAAGHARSGRGGGAPHDRAVRRPRSSPTHVDEESVMRFKCEDVGLEFFDEAPTRYVGERGDRGDPRWRCSTYFWTPTSWTRWAWPITEVEWTSGFPIEVGSTRTVYMRGGIIGIRGVHRLRTRRPHGVPVRRGVEAGNRGLRRGLPSHRPGRRQMSGRLDDGDEERSDEPSFVSSSDGSHHELHGPPHAPQVRPTGGDDKGWEAKMTNLEHRDAGRHRSDRRIGVGEGGAARLARPTAVRGPGALASRDRWSGLLGPDPPRRRPSGVDVAG